MVQVKLRNELTKEEELGYLDIILSVLKKNGQCIPEYLVTNEDQSCYLVNLERYGIYDDYMIEFYDDESLKYTIFYQDGDIFSRPSFRIFRCDNLEYVDRTVGYKVILRDYNYCKKYGKIYDKNYTYYDHMINSLYKNKVTPMIIEKLEYHREMILKEINLTTNKNDNLTTNKNDNLTTNKNDNLTTNKNDNLTTNKNDNLTTNKNDNLTTNKNDNLTTNKNDNLTTNKNDNLTTNKNDLNTQQEKITKDPKQTTRSNNKKGSSATKELNKYINQNSDGLNYQNQFLNPTNTTAPRIGSTANVSELNTASALLIGLCGGGIILLLVFATCYIYKYYKKKPETKTTECELQSLREEKVRNVDHE